MICPDHAFQYLFPFCLTILSQPINKTTKTAFVLRLRNCWEPPPTGTCMRESKMSYIQKTKVISLDNDTPPSLKKVFGPTPTPKTAHQSLKNVKMTRKLGQNCGKQKNVAPWHKYQGTSFVRSSKFHIRIIYQNEGFFMLIKKICISLRLKEISIPKI